VELAGKVALVTGAGGARLGRAIALAIASRGAAIGVHYRSNERGALELVAEIERSGGRAAIFRADLERPPEIEALVGSVVSTLGGLDVLVSNASVFRRTPFATTTERDWDEALDTNLKAPFLLARAAAPHLGARGPGKIVHVADTSALRPWPEYIPYCVSKAGLIALTQGLARALAPQVLVNAVAPGPVLPPEGASEEEVRRAIARVPLGRVGSPGDVAAAVLFLLEGSDYVTGAVIPVDGGRSIA